MKRLISFLIFFLLYANISTAQDSLYCFTKVEIVKLSNRIRLIQDSNLYLVDLNKKQDGLIYLLDSSISIYKQQDDLYKRKDTLWKKREIQYKNIIKNMQPAWYENKYLWFGLGILTASIIIR